MADAQTVNGNPAVVGLAGFGLTTMILQFHNVGWCGVGPIVALGLVFGGMAQMIAGFQEFKCGNNFGYSAFVSYGDKIPGDANDLMRIAIPRMEKQSAGIVSRGREIGRRMRSLIERELPDDAARNVFTVAIGREFGDVTARQGIDELYQAVRAARTAGDGLEHLRVRHATTAIRALAGARHSRIVDPALPTALRVEGDDAVERRAVDQVFARLARQQDRRGLSRDTRGRVFGGGHVAVTMGPDRFELRHVVRRDLRCWTVVLAERVAGGVCRRCDERKQQEGCRCYGCS